MSLNVLKKLKNVLMTSVVTATALSATNVFAESPKYTGDYTIEAMINKYNVVTLGQEELHENMPDYTYADSTGNVTNVQHIVGPVLVEGEIGPFTNNSGKSIDLYNVALGTNLYIQGKFNAWTTNVSNQDGDKPTLYFGSANEGLFDIGSQYDQQTYWYYGGYKAYFSQNKFEIVDNYIDFKKLYNDIRTQQKLIKKGTVVTPEYINQAELQNVIFIKYGDYYTIESFEGVDAIVLYGFEEAEDNTTVINVLFEGDSTKSITIPRLLVQKTADVKDENREQISIDAMPAIDSETGKIINVNEKIRNVIWNIPNAEYITFQPSVESVFVGHIIAPQADIQLLKTNYGGCILANSVRGDETNYSQAYFQPYGDAELELEEEEEEPTQIVVNVEKRAESVNGKLLAGAKLQLIDKDGNILDTWTSTEEAYSLDVSKLTINETYIIREVSAPEGYSLAQDLSITIKDTETIQVFTVVNVLEPEAEEPTPEDPEEPGPTIVGDAEVENPDTGDNIILYIGIVVGSLAAIIGLVVALIKMKKKKLN